MKAHQRFYLSLYFSILSAKDLVEAAVEGFMNWTWISGDAEPNARANYGLKNIPSPENKIGARHLHTMALDSKRQLLYVFGGRGFDDKGSNWGTIRTTGQELTTD